MKALWCICISLAFPLTTSENKLFGIHQTSFLPVEALEFSERKTPLVYTFLPPKKVTLWATFQSLWGKPTLESLLIFGDSGGSRGFLGSQCNVFSEPSLGRNVFSEPSLDVVLPQPSLETNLASRWEGVRLPRASGKSPDFPGSSPNFPGSFSATSPEVLSLWSFTAIQGFPGSFPDFPGSSPNFPGSFPDFPGGQPFLWEA